MEWEVDILRAVSWAELESKQEALVTAVRENPERRFLLVSEPTPTYTAGRSAAAADLLVSPGQLEILGTTVAQVSRGGQWTYHGPGQLLVYPITALSSLGLGSKQIRGFVDGLREACGKFLLTLDVDATLKDDPYGVFVGNKKIVSFGLDFRQGISRHGLALYLTPQQAAFENIHPCGTPGQAFTSLAEEGRALSWDNAANQLITHIKVQFHNSSKTR